ncbi:MAG: 1-(5-phosphoribosyl)-5-[(5-phosphoribosylamino)methylideneamino] imidazole-4-carboxamide isomerase [Gammaproteobacteria bacterium]|nr:1-(5-phosphoribosyl)-5-[(5-phosphoribosylamino)methylideneamino] imidazole-4-carboxamide isomerase [Gammaproteobacteria bacterium]
MEIIPAIDLLDGGVVRLFKGDFDQVTRYAQDPVSLARSYLDAGLKRLHAVDLDGAKTGDPVNMPLIGQFAATGLRVQAGGGIRDQARLEGLLAAGAERAVIGSVAVQDPDRVAGWLQAVGPQRIVLALDVRLDAGIPVAQTHGWTRGSGVTLWELLDHYLPLGVRDVLCTDIALDGTLAGPNVDLYRDCVERYPEASFIASGGVSRAADLPALAATGVAGVVSGKALLDGRLTLQEIEQFLRDG